MAVTRLQKRGRCYVLELPPELRLYIYEHLLDSMRDTHKEDKCPSCCRVSHRFPEGTLRLWTDGIHINGLDHGNESITRLTTLLRICKQIHAEAAPLVMAHLEARQYMIVLRNMPEPRDSPPSKWAREAWPLEAYPALKHVRNLELSLIVNVNSTKYLGLALESLELLFGHIHNGSKLHSLDIHITRWDWPRLECL